MLINTQQTKFVLYNEIIWQQENFNVVIVCGFTT